jgi:hypothetical protein
MKRVNQLEEVKKTNCYNWDIAVTSYTQYEPQSKIFWTGAAIYPAVVVARSTGRW